ncbi:MAG: choice-of-anchor D domain-containing protein [Deltaproteobacteria bacterium]|nr:choice-of-anchor D domain-containing protein [Deltaproteobacteria bacterium]
MAPRLSGALWIWGAGVGILACEDEGAIIRLAPELRAQPSVEFELTPLFATRHQWIGLENSGNAPLRISELVTNGPFKARVSKLALGPNEAVTLDLSYGPESIGPSEGSISIVSAELPPVEISLTGSATVGLVAVNPPSLDFGDLTLGTSRKSEVSFVNYQLQPISGRLVAGGFQRPEFWAGGPLPNAEPMDVGIEAQRDFVMSLEFFSRELGADSGYVQLEYCGEGCGVEVEAQGNAVESAIWLEPAFLEFGDLDVGYRKLLTLNVRNSGTQQLEVSRLRVIGTGDVRVTDTPLPMRIEAGGAKPVTLSYVPGTVGPMTGELLVESSDRATPQVVAALSGNGAGAVLLVRPERIHFGVAIDPGPHTRPAILLNAGSAPITVSTLSVTGSPEISLGDVSYFPVRLEAGESIDANVEFTPTDFGTFSATVSVVTDHPEYPDVRIPITAGFAEEACQLAMAPTEVNFGIVPVGHVRRRSVRVTNTGRDSCTFVSGGLAFGTDATFSVNSEPVWPLELAANESLELELAFAPFQRAPVRATTYTLKTSDPFFPAHVVRLSGSTIPDPAVFVDPSVLDFGAQDPSCPASSEQTTRIFNTGVTAVTVESVTLEDSLAYQLAGATQFPYVLAAGSFLELVVQARTASASHERTWAEILVREKPFPLQVALLGKSDRAEVMVDLFSQRDVVPNEPVDVLFAISDNCIMNFRQRQLSDNAEAFIRAAELARADLRIGVTTTAMDGVSHAVGGKLVGPVLTLRTPDLVQAFKDQAVMGGRGRHFDRGMEVLDVALGLSENRVLFRPGSRRVLFVITNEEDYSPLAPGAYAARLAARPEGHQVVLVIAGTQPSCSIIGGTPRYQDYAIATSAVVESICAQDWPAMISQLGAEVFGSRARFPLSSRAQEATIVVTVDGVPVISGWAYSSPANAVIFSAGSEPPPGSTVRISYSRGC